MNQKLQQLVSQMTLEEKAGFCSGADSWHTKGLARLGIPAVMLSDGPHGLRKKDSSSDPLDTDESVPATCFPTAVTTSCSFDRELLRDIGAAIGREATQEEIAVVLGPGANIKRSPLCGRNFEYFSEDPFLSGEMAAALIQGIQSQNVGTSLKHFTCNNQETARMINDSIVDERTLREIYLTPFEIAVKKGSPWTIMGSYNKVNGTYACENKLLLTDILRNEWKFNGAVMTDWGAMNDPVLAINAGLDLEMPYSGPERAAEIVSAVRSGRLKETILDQAVIRVMEIWDNYQNNTNIKRPYDKNAHNTLARRAVCESAVLLKNDGVLPLKETDSVAVIGEFAETPRYQGSGSSKVKPNKITNALEIFYGRDLIFDYAQGYDLNGKQDPEALIAQATEAARLNDYAIIFAGLPDEYESEGFDRTHIDLPKEQNDLIERVAAENPNSIVVLHAGSAVRMPWLDKVKAVLMLGLGGQSVGGATVDILFGKVSPSGKLSETYPRELTDVPSKSQFGDRLVTQYRESIYVGYRYYDKAQKAVLFPFGHGLSYTSFEYSDLRLSSNAVNDESGVEVTLKVKNVGPFDGKEVVQLYVSSPSSKLFKPEKEMKDFCKIFLKRGEEQEVSFRLGKRAFAYWNVNIHDWHVETGMYRLLVGSSSRDIRCEAIVDVQSSSEGVTVPSYQDAAPIYYSLPTGDLNVPLDQFKAVYGREVTTNGHKPMVFFDVNSTLSDIKDKLVGRIFIKTVRKKMQEMTGADQDQKGSSARMFNAMLNDMPLRSFSMGGMSLSFLEGLMLVLNRRFFKGIMKLLKDALGSKKN